MKKVFTNSELCHVWASQAQEVGQNANSSMFFEGDTIYSYGYHYPAAKMYKDTAGFQVVLINNTKYSTTTCKHMYSITRAVQHLPTFPVGNVESLEKARLSLSNEVYELILDFYTQRVIKIHPKDILSRIKLLESFDEMLGVKKNKEVTSLLNYVYSEITPYYKEFSFPLYKTQEKRQEERKAKKEQLKRMSEEEKLPLWLSRKYHNTLSNTPVHFRLSADKSEIETSHGARVPLQQSIDLWKELETIPSTLISGLHIGHYRVDEVNNDTIRIGCHTIERKILNEFMTQITKG
jgi:hypothetical protein